jgi:ABC-type dipeptide/oligopeptide/nickel transport system permease component
MLRYILIRLALAIPVLLAVFTLVFLVVRIIPGDPAQAALGDYASQEAVEALRERMGLNEPLYVQYFRYLGDLVRGDLGMCSTFATWATWCGGTWGIRSSPATPSASR